MVFSVLLGHAKISETKSSLKSTHQSAHLPLVTTCCRDVRLFLKPWLFTNSCVLNGASRCFQRAPASSTSSRTPRGLSASYSDPRAALPLRADPLAHSSAGLTSLLSSNCSQKCSCLGACPNTAVEYHRDIQLPWDNPDLILAGLSAWQRFLSARGF